MAVCLEYQSVYCDRRRSALNVRLHLVALFFLFASLAIRVWVKIETTQTGYLVARERERAMTLDMERRELELQHSVLLRTDSVRQMAKERLGLGAAESGQVKKIFY